ncbi:YegS/Rv2252/BmrU family lipid kinase [Candidatus Woesearchaeota archaeon]|nr:YegS/Rv2252/BmrU family lipid kinase [Candidatus Woesearchaeota archaeon]
MQAKTLLIINPASGKAAASVVHLIERTLAVFPAISVMKTAKKGDAALFAKKTGAERILIAGGDGTINEVLNGLMKNPRQKKQTIGIIPLGTSNMVGRSFGIPGDIDKALNIIKKGKRQHIDVGKANHRYFLIGAGVGVDAAMYRNVEPLLKKIFGEIAYPVALVKTILTHDPQELTLHFSGKKVSCYYALVCNIGKFSGILEIVPNSRPDDGSLDVIVFQNKDVMNQFKYCLGLATKKHASFSDVKIFKVKKVKITGKDAMVHCDAELIGKTPVKITCVPRAIAIFVP